MFLKISPRTYSDGGKSDILWRDSVNIGDLVVVVVVGNCQGNVLDTEPKNDQDKCNPDHL